MKHPIQGRVLTLGSVAALTAGLIGGTAQAAQVRAAGPAQLVLHLSDLPKNFVLVQGQAETAAQAGTSNGMTGAQMRTAGYVTGYLNEYEKKGLEQATTASQVKGLVIALSAVFQFRQPTGAHTVYGELLRYIPKQSTLKGFKMMSFPKVGTESQGYSYHKSVSGVPITFDFLVSRHGKYVDLVGGGGAAMTLGKEDSAVTNLARVVDSRVASKG